MCIDALNFTVRPRCRLRHDPGSPAGEPPEVHRLQHNRLLLVEAGLLSAERVNRSVTSSASDSACLFAGMLSTQAQRHAYLRGSMLEVSVHVLKCICCW
jgi:hypothetical protein